MASSNSRTCAPSDATGYTIVEDPLSGDAFVDEPGDGTPDVQQDLIVTGKGTLTVVLGGNQNKDFSTAAADKNIFGNYVFGSIHGVKFHDLDGDGKWDKGTAPGSTEPALPGIKFDLFQWVSKVTTKFVSGKTVVTNQWKDVGDATSNVHGEFWFVGLSPGNYLVVEQKNADWIQTTDQVKDPNAPDAKNPNMVGVDKSLGFEIVSRREWVWEIGASSRPMDGMGGPLDGIIDKGEVQAGYNKGALKVEVLATRVSIPVSRIAARTAICGSVTSGRKHHGLQVRRSRSEWCLQPGHRRPDEGRNDAPRG